MVIHQSGINVGCAGYPPAEFSEGVAQLMYAFGPDLTARETCLFFSTLSLPVWPAVAAVFAGILLKCFLLKRDNRFIAGIGNFLLIFGFLAGLAVSALLSVSQGKIGLGVLALMAAAVAGLAAESLDRQQKNGN